ncbi:MAG TPA: gamma-glutamyl-gamma-aminobutyrate hydrolase family protein [Actinomycetes bacterium]
MRPLVGITASFDRATWSLWRDEVALVPAAYVRAVQAAGGHPVVLPPDADAAAVLPRLDALVLSGGADLDPGRYGATAGPETSDVRNDQDDAELDLLVAALDHRVPVLGICRGLQLLAVASGGRLHQHLPATPGHEQHGGHGGEWTEHEVTLVPGTRLHGLLGERVLANSGHHQGIADAGHLVVSGHSPDGLIEAAEVDTGRHPFAVGVQWHPEMTGDPRLFEALVGVALVRS